MTYENGALEERLWTSELQVIEHQWTIHNTVAGSPHGDCVLLLCTRERARKALQR